jgi:alpha-acetolactate decarboxylase
VIHKIDRFKEAFHVKHLILSAIILLGQVTLTFAQPSDPFAVTHYGQFKYMMHTGKTDGVVNLKEALDRPHVFAVGAIAQGTGEITVIDGRVWLNYGADGLGDSREKVPPGEKAVLLVRAQVEDWISVNVPEDMAGEKMHVFLLAEAESHGLDIGKPFPFLLEGSFSDVDWHVVNGRRESSGDHKQWGIFNKLTEHRDQTDGTVIGFFSAAEQGVYTHPGESWHLHIVFADEGKAGHLDALAVKQGTVLKLPVNRDL